MWSIARSRHWLPVSHQFSTSSVLHASRALVYEQNGNPTFVLSSVTWPSLPPPQPDTLNIKFLLSPINPADINVIEGVYPSKPSPSTSLPKFGKGSPNQPVFIAGNEGLAQVMEVGSAVKSLKIGDWVIMTKQQAGTWASHANVRVDDVLTIPRYVGEVNGAVMTVNPPTAYNMLHDFAKLEEGDWVVQNGGNGAVGQAVIQIAASRGLKTVNFVRNRTTRPGLDGLQKQLTKLGANHVLTYDDLADKSLRQKVEEWTGGKDIRLGLNCVGGMETSLMARLLGHNAHLISYGAMSKQPLSLPTSLFIFKNLTSHGFWQSRWYMERTREERESLMKVLAGLIKDGKLAGPEHEIVILGSHETDEEVAVKVRSFIAKMSKGRYGKKVLLKIEEPL